MIKDLWFKDLHSNRSHLRLRWICGTSIMYDCTNDITNITSYFIMILDSSVYTQKVRTKTLDQISVLWRYEKSKYLKFMSRVVIMKLVKKLRPKTDFFHLFLSFFRIFWPKIVKNRRKTTKFSENRFASKCLKFFSLNFVLKTLFW